MSTSQRLEKQVDDFKRVMQNRDTVLRLYENKDFKSIIMEEFMVQECARYAQISADPNMSSDNRADALALAQAAGHLKRYLDVVVRMGDTAEKELPELYQTLEEVRAEELQTVEGAE